MWFSCTLKTASVAPCTSDVWTLLIIETPVVAARFNGSTMESGSACTSDVWTLLIVETPLVAARFNGDGSQVQLTSLSGVSTDGVCSGRARGLESW